MVGGDPWAASVGVNSASLQQRPVGSSGSVCVCVCVCGGGGLRYLWVDAGVSEDAQRALVVADGEQRHRATLVVHVTAAADGENLLVLLHVDPRSCKQQ